MRNCEKEKEKDTESLYDHEKSRCPCSLLQLITLENDQTQYLSVAITPDIASSW